MLIKNNSGQKSLCLANFSSKKKKLPPQNWSLTMDKYHQEKCCLEKCYPDIWYPVKMAHETYLQSLVKIGKVTAEILLIWTYVLGTKCCMGNLDIWLIYGWFCPNVSVRHDMYYFYISKFPQFRCGGMKFPIFPKCNFVYIILRNRGGKEGDWPQKGEWLPQYCVPPDPLKLTLLESFRAIKLLNPYWRFLGP